MKLSIIVSIFNDKTIDKIRYVRLSKYSFSFPELFANNLAALLPRNDLKDTNLQSLRIAILYLVFRGQLA